MPAFRKRPVWQWMSLVVAMGCGSAEGHEELGIDNDSLAQQASTPPTAAVKPVISSLMIPVSVLGTGKANIYAKIFENPTIPQGATIFDVHGLASTGRVFDPLTQAVWDDPSQAARVKRVITIDMPGHGGSTLPTNLPRGSNFGSLSLDDNVGVILQVLEQLRAKNLGPQLIVGHSMGALALTAAQQRLIDQGSSFAKIGVTYVLLIAPIPSHGLPWTQPASSEAAKLVPFVKYELLGANAKGIYVQLPTTEWIQASFVDKTGKLTAATPTPAQVEAAGYMAIEPLVTLLQLTEGTIPGGPPPMNRPTVKPGVFDANSGTKLAVVSFSEDGLLLPSDVHNFYQHLTGDKTDFRFLSVNSSEAVHNMTISKPSQVIEAMKILFK